MCKKDIERENVIHSGSSEVGSPQVAASRGLNPFLSVGTFGFGFGRALARLHSELCACVFLPLVTVVDPGAAQGTRQLLLRLCVVFNQLGERTEFSLAFLPQRQSKGKEIGVIQSHQFVFKQF